MSFMLQCYSVIIDRGISTPWHVKEVVDGINAIDKRYIYQLMSSFQLIGSNIFYSQMQMHTSAQNGVSENEESVEVVGGDFEGDGEYGSNGAVPCDDV